MPGRGRPWKGVGEGNPDRIGTGAIADGSITEADLDSSVTSKLNSTGGHEILDEGTPLTQQSKMNFVGAGVTASVGGEDTTIVTIPSGGGVWTKIGEFTATGAQATLPVTFTSSQAEDTFMQILVVAEFDLNVADQVDLELTGPTGFSLRVSAVNITGAGVVSGIASNQADLLGTGKNFGISGSNSMRVSIQYDLNGNLLGYIDEETDIGQADATRRGGWRGDTTSSVDISGIVLKAKVNNFNIGSKVRVYVQSL